MCDDAITDDIIIFDREVVVVVVVLGGNDTTNLCQPDDTSIVFPKAFFISLSLFEEEEYEGYV